GWQPLFAQIRQIERHHDKAERERHLKSFRVVTLAVSVSVLIAQIDKVGWAGRPWTKWEDERGNISEHPRRRRRRERRFFASQRAVDVVPALLVLFAPTSRFLRPGARRKLSACRLETAQLELLRPGGRRRMGAREEDRLDQSRMRGVLPPLLISGRVSV